MARYRMKEIRKTGHTITVRFCHGAEKLFFREDLRYRYPDLTDEQAERLMLGARLSSDGQTLMFGEFMEISAADIYNYVCPDNIYGILAQRDAERMEEKHRK